MAGSPMRKVALRNLAAHKVRLALTLLSVVLGTAFIAGSFVFTDTLQRTFDGIFAGQAKGVDVRVSPKERQAQGVPNNIVDQLQKYPGVRTAAPSVNGVVVLLTPDGKKAIQTGGAPTFGQSYLPPERAVAEPNKFVEGVPPSKPGEIALNVGGAERAGVKIGEHTKVLVPSQGNPLDVTLTGIYEVPSDTGGFIGVLFDDVQARKLFTDGLHVAYVDIAATGIPGDQLRDNLAKELPNLKVQNGDQVRADLKKEVSNALNFINYFLLAFGAIALIVGTFIIYNTFSMIVAQRLRELALLRAVGASRQQVGRSVVAEAFVIGLVGSAIGLAGGVGLAFGLSAVLNAFDLGLPTGSMTVLPRTIVVGLLVGLAVTVLSAYAPARRAAKIPPVEAMREEFASAGDSLRMRTWLGAVLAVAGVVLVYLGAQSTGGDAALTVGIGALALILAVLLAAPALSRPVVGGLGVLTRPFGPIGRMARNNAARNPRRTAATAFALTLGLMLVTAIGMLGASAKASVGVLVDKGVKSEYVLATQQFVGVPFSVADSVRKSVPGVADVVGIRGVGFQLGDDQIGGTSPDGPLDRALNYEILRGSGTLGDRDMLVSEDEATKRGWRVGQQVTPTSFDGKKVPLTVTGIYRKTPLLGAVVVSPAVYREVVPVNLQRNIVVLVKAQPGANLAEMRADLEKVVEPFPVVQVQDREEFKGAQGRQINTLLAILYGLLALAVVIAILGIVNTLALSVVERRREIGMLRAVGMQRAQVRRTIYLESMLIAVFGAIVGMLLGLGLGVGFLRTLRDLGLDQIAVPWSQLVLVLVSSAVVGVLAALWPGVRAARTPPLAAIADL
ncbi:putative ABC transport system permease protein [Nocardia tenerifensis]|uniref:Putative ABC transport system permease protein n=1 Tax=Nocardia tenerifensis TaxID=228006 RepID=A0A318KD02_9NOCA|nr:FtsX-like permease family protein [Nocardia tenerifensis]PXX68939.1 putative ABC transport system permease protein [Nocardia tenerifensis]